MSSLIEIYEFGQNSTTINQLRINLCNVNNYVHRYLYVYFSDIRYSCQIRNRESRDQCDNSTMYMYMYLYITYYTNFL